MLFMEKSYDYALSMTILADEVYDVADINDLFGEKVFKIFDIAGNATYWYCIYVRLPEKTYATYVLVEISREIYFLIRVNINMKRCLRLWIYILLLRF